MSPPRISLLVVLRVRLVFEGTEEPRIFSVLEPSRGKLRIFPSTRAYMEKTDE